MPADVVDTLIARLSDGEAPAEVDLEAQICSVAGQSVGFELDPVWREKLVNGWDDIDLTRKHASEIATFRKEYLRMQPWAFPVEGTAG